MTAHPDIKGTEVKPALTVAIFYEDWGTGLRAKQTCDQLEQNITPEVSLSLELWRFDLLEEPTLREQAASAAANSDIILVSAHGHGALPDATVSWLEQWLIQKPDEPTALVISLDSSTQGSATANQILAFLAQAAESAGVELFFHFGHAHHLRSEPTIKSPLPPHGHSNIATGQSPWEQ